jgi:hypothetical protein
MLPTRRIRRPAAALLAVALAALIAMCALPGGIIRLSANAAAANFACQQVPVPSPAPSATPSPASLCVSVLAAQDSADPGATVGWTVAVWVQGAIASPVSVTLATSPASVGAFFTGSCPTGNMASSCGVGALGTGTVPSLYQMQAQFQVPPSATGSVTLFATASAATDPLMPQYPQAAQTITVNSPSPTPSASASATASPSPSATASPTGSSGAAASSPAAARTSGTPRSSSGATVPSAPGVGVGVGNVLPAPVLPAPVQPGPIPNAGNSSSLLPAGTIASMLPVLTPSNAPPSSSPAANVQVIPAASGGVADSGRFSLTIGMPGDTAKAVALIGLAVVTVVAVTLIARSRRSATRAGRTAQNEVGITRWLLLMMRKRSGARHKPGPPAVPPDSLPD